MQGEVFTTNAFRSIQSLYSSRYGTHIVRSRSERSGQENAHTELSAGHSPALVWLPLAARPENSRPVIIFAVLRGTIYLQLLSKKDDKARKNLCRNARTFKNCCAVEMRDRRTRCELMSTLTLRRWLMCAHRRPDRHCVEHDIVKVSTTGVAAFGCRAARLFRPGVSAGGVYLCSAL